MISSFTISNFKAFGAAQTIPLKPITLIFGPNSAGKSSVIHALLLARQALDNGGNLDVFKTDIGGDSVDLGGFRQYLFRRNRNPNGAVEWRASLSAESLPARSRELLPARDVEVLLQWKQPLNDFGELVEGAPPAIVTLEFFADGESAFRLSRRPDRTMQIDRAAPAILANIAGAILENHSIGPADLAAHRENLSRLLAQIAGEVRFDGRDFLPMRVVSQHAGESTRGSSDIMVALGRGTREEDLAGTARLFGPRLIGELICGMGEAFSNELFRLTYLGPLRSYPSRHLAFAEDHDRNWKAGGGYAWDVIRTDDAVREAVNRWLSGDVLKTKYRLEIRTLSAIEALEDPLRDTLEEVQIDIVEEGHPGGVDFAGREHDGDLPVYGIQDLESEAARFVRELRRRAHETIKELVLMDIVQKTAVSHRDVGIGVSQVLPVLVHAYADRSKLVAIEQPEIHLHPALQAELADVFIESALGDQKNTFLLETHSEHLILRILRRIRETADGELPPGRQPITPNDVIVLYVKPGAEGSQVVELVPNTEGDFDEPWPDGFFPERTKELF